MPEIIKTEVISWYYDNLLGRYFGINKTQELVAQKYYSKIFYQDVECYLKVYDIYLASKVIRHKLYRNLQL